jgi:hypothetical protein
MREKLSHHFRGLLSGSTMLIQKRLRMGLGACQYMAIKLINFSYAHRLQCLIHRLQQRPSMLTLSWDMWLLWPRERDESDGPVMSLDTEARPKGNSFKVPSLSEPLCSHVTDLGQSATGQRPWKSQRVPLRSS